MSRFRDSHLLRRYPWIILGILLSIGFYDIENKRLAGVIWSDAEGYYLYLPAVFIYGGFEGIPYRTTVQFSNYPGTEKVFTKYTCGVAMLEMVYAPERSEKWLRTHLDNIIRIVEKYDVTVFRPSRFEVLEV